MAVAREALKRPWLGTGFDRTKIREKLNPIPPELDSALQLASEITPILAEGARGNPRQIKRFVNTMALRMSIAAERGFKDDIRQAVLAKLMLAERFAPEVFDAIALDAAADGSKTIAALEAKEDNGKGGTGLSADAIVDWPNLEWAKRWAGILPTLTGLDVRPYVFVSRDRRVASGAGLTSGPIEAMIERLSSSSLAITQIPKADMVALMASDAERIFQALVTKIDQTEDLGSRPTAAVGLAALCSARPELRESLVTFLARLPVSKIDGWVVSGWELAVDGPQTDGLAISSRSGPSRRRIGTSVALPACNKRLPRPRKK